MKKMNKVGRKYVALNDFNDSESGRFFEGDEFEIISLEDYGYVVYHSFPSNIDNGVHALIYDVKTFHRNVKLIDEIVDKWKSLGFLDGLTEDTEIMLAHGMEYVAKKLISDDKQNERVFNDKVDVIMFPILRRLTIMLPLLEFTDEFLDNLLLKVLELTNSPTYDGIQSMHGGGHFDAEAELINLFLEVNYGQ